MSSSAKRKAKGGPKSDPEPMAVHAAHEDGKHHVVGVGNIRVFLVPDGSAWFAQGLEIDYAAYGRTREEARQAFESGLAATVEQHLRVHGNISGLLQVSPPEIWSKLVFEKGAVGSLFSQVTTHHIIRENTPFQGIEYLSEVNAAS
ncbi:MAG: hypothetical protein ACK5AZ_17940 [Bryobacteraceae bacterium]